MNDLYRRCPDCDGVGSISVMSSDPGMHETEYECERCRFTKGYVKVEPTDHIEWCFTCGHKPYTDGLGYEHEKDSGCKGQSHDIGTLARVDMKDTT